MIRLKTSNGAFSDHGSRRNSFADQFHDVESAGFGDLIHKKLLLDDLVGVFEIFDLDQFFMCGVEVLQVDRLIDALVGVFEVILLHVHFVYFEFHLLDVLELDCKNNIVLGLEEFLGFFSQDCDFLGFF